MKKDGCWFSQTLLYLCRQAEMPFRTQHNQDCSRDDKWPETQDCSYQESMSWDKQDIRLSSRPIPYKRYPSPLKEVLLPFF